MNVIYSVKDYVTNVFELHQGADSGAIDVVAVQHDDGALHCSPFHVHFGKHKLKGAQVDKRVTLEVNGAPVHGVRMKLGAAGEAFFVAEVHEPVEEVEYRTSPLASPVQHGGKNRDSVGGFDEETLSSLDLTNGDGRDHEATIKAQSSVKASDEATLRPDTSKTAQSTLEWHDSYRLERAPFEKPSDAVSDRLTWGWGALPTMRSTVVDDEAEAETEVVATDNETDEHGDALSLPEDERLQLDDDEHELPMMIKSNSIYFDAVEAEASSNSLIDLDPASLESNAPCISLCGHLIGKSSSRDEAAAIFAANMVSFEAFRANPTSVLTDPNLMVLINGQLSPFTLEAQAALMARVLFPYSPSLSPIPTRKVYVPVQVPADEVAVDTMERDLPRKEGERGLTTSPGPAHILTKEAVERHLNSSCPRSSSTSLLTALDPVDEASSESGSSTEDTGSYSGEVYYRKSLRPSQVDLLSMNLRAGMNNISFVVKSSTDDDVEVARIDSKLYLWPASAKIVIAQIDGAISRTSSGGMFKRRDSSLLHDGAQAFYSKLARNGYHIVYLTCHGLSQAELIHAMLSTPTSPSTSTASFSLPHGPVLLSPDRLLETASNEMIDAHEFKAAALDAIRSLFPPDVNAFYAAFGKTAADGARFVDAGVFPAKVFLVDEENGRLRHRSLLGFHESYASLRNRADTMFPPIYSPLAPLLSPLSPPGSTSSRSSFSSSPDRRRSSAASKSAVGSEDLVSEAVAAHVRSRSLVDDAYNDVNFWRIKPGMV